jgi:hypothetical protein
MTTRQASALLMLMSILVVMVGANIALAGRAGWQYRIISFKDAALQEGMRDWGDHGWDLAFARRAVTGTGAESEGIYECIFKRPMTVFDWISQVFVGPASPA